MKLKLIKYIKIILGFFYSLLKPGKAKKDFNNLAEQKKNQKAIITFDYELFLGKDSGTCEKSLIEPANKIRDVLIKHKAKAIFFVDTTYILHLKKNNHPDYKKIENQLIDLVKNNNSIELHLHPHWLDAKPLVKDRWYFTSHEKYRLHSLTEKEIEKIFSEGSNLINSIYKKAKTNQKVSAFRAGGWSIMPFSPIIKKNFIKTKIKFDFSVIAGEKKLELPNHYYDYSNVDKKKNYWQFSKEPVIIDKEGFFTEIPVATAKFSIIYRLISRYIRRYMNYYGDGKGMSRIRTENKIIVYLKELKRNYTPIYIDSYYPFFFNSLLRKVKQKEIVTLVGHPKTMSSIALKNLELVCKRYKTLNIADLKKEFISNK
ncbi:MAG: hypothetical protein OEZ22_03270 [Spirochaetia bacterium]|nr:hypothetical protein [Spirochaetia bacterium]